MQGEKKHSECKDGFELEADPTGGLPACSIAPTEETTDWGKAAICAVAESGQLSLALTTF